MNAKVRKPKQCYKITNVDGPRPLEGSRRGLENI